MAVVAFAAIATDAGTVTAALSLERLTLTPPVGAGADKVTVQVSFPAPLKELVEHERLLRASAGFSCKAKTCETPFAAAVSVAICAEVTAAIVAVKLAVVELAATVTEAGTVAAELLLDKFTLSPPAGAADDSVTVQLSLPEPVMEPLVQAMLAGVGGALSCRANDEVAPLAVAVRVAV